MKALPDPTRDLEETADLEETVEDNAGPPLSFTGPKRIASYRVLRELGAGGMGTVFEAHDEKMNRRVALKVLSRHQAPSEKSEQRFAREAWIAGRLNHPNLVKVFEHAHWEELSYYSMELVHGGSLSDVLKNMKRWGRDDRLGLEFGSSEYLTWVLRTVADAARGLGYAHRQGVVHRDVKPMNLLLSRETGKVKIADFGLAIEQDASRMTTAGKVLGTLAYMSPEQILGKQKIDARTDIYALGVTLFELLTLAFPYAGETQQMYLNAVLSSEARPARKLNARVGRDLDIVIRKAIEKRPEDRYAAADELADDLENVLHFRPIHAVPPSPAARAIKWVRRKPLHAALAALLAVGLPVIALLGQRASERQTLMREREIAQGVDDVRWLRQRARHAELIERASRILELDPDHELALQLRAVSHLALAVDGEDAGGHAAAALSDIDRLAGLLPGEVWPLRLEGYALDKLGRVDEAAAVHAAVEAARPETRKETYNDLFFDGLLAQERGDHEAALAFFERARALSPSSTEPIQLHAASLEALGRPAEAIQDYRLIVGLNPDDGYGNLDLGRLLTETGAAEEGEAYMRRASRRLPENALVHQALAHNTLARGHAATGAGDLETAATLFARAEAHARDSLRFGPDDPWSHLDLGAALTDQERIAGTNSPQRVEEAIEHYRSALDLLRQREGGEAAEQYAAALVNICDAVILMGRLEQALVDCRNAVQRLPDDAMGFYNLAGVYALLGRPEEALEALERDFELGDRDWAYLESDAWFESLRRDPRFRDLVDRMKYRTDAASETRTN